MANTYALISGGVVINTVLWDGGSSWAPPAGCTCVQIDTITPQPGIGWTYNGSTFTPPSPPAPTPDLYDFSNALMISSTPTSADMLELPGWLAGLQASLQANDLITIENGWAKAKADSTFSSGTTALIISLASQYNIPGIS